MRSGGILGQKYLLAWEIYNSGVQTHLDGQKQAYR